MREKQSRDAASGHIRGYPDAIATALNQLRLVGVNGPYSVVLSADAYLSLSETSDHGYPVLEHVKHLIDGGIIWAPPSPTPLCSRLAEVISRFTSVRTCRLATSATMRERSVFTFEETLTFLVLTAEASVLPTAPRS